MDARDSEPATPQDGERILRVGDHAQDLISTQLVGPDQGNLKILRKIYALGIQYTVSILLKTKLLKPVLYIHLFKIKKANGPTNQCSMMDAVSRLIFQGLHTFNRYLPGDRAQP